MDATGYGTRMLDLRFSAQRQFLPNPRNILFERQAAGYQTSVRRLDETRESAASRCQRARARSSEDQLKVEDAGVEAVQVVLRRDRVGRDAALTSAGGDLERDAARERALLEPLRADHNGARATHTRVEVQLVQHRPRIHDSLARAREEADVGLRHPLLLR